VCACHPPLPSPPLPYPAATLPRMRAGALPIVRDNYRINKFTSWRNVYNISTSAKWYRDTVVYHRGSYSPRPVTHCRAYVVSRYPFGSYPPRCSMVRIVRHARSTPLKNRACLSEVQPEVRGESPEGRTGSAVRERGVREARFAVGAEGRHPPDVSRSREISG